jgi:hypothetical protein
MREFPIKTVLLLGICFVAVGTVCILGKTVPYANLPPVSKASASATPTTSGLIGPGALTFKNATAADVTVFVAFGSDSVVSPADWPFCKGSGLNCNFPLPANTEQFSNINNKYLNATISFIAPVTCNVTKAEFNINNPKWYDITDVSLVDGYNGIVEVKIDTQTSLTISPVGKSGNEKAFGVYPYGCDICTARQNPPCSIPKGSDGCKGGTQYKPDVPCQYQGAKIGGGLVKYTVIWKG